MLSLLNRATKLISSHNHDKASTNDAAPGFSLLTPAGLTINIHNKLSPMTLYIIPMHPNMAKIVNGCRKTRNPWPWPAGGYYKNQRAAEYLNLDVCTVQEEEYLYTSLAS